MFPFFLLFIHKNITAKEGVVKCHNNIFVNFCSFLYYLKFENVCKRVLIIIEENMMKQGSKYDHLCVNLKMKKQSASLNFLKSFFYRLCSPNIKINILPIGAPILCVILKKN